MISKRSCARCKRSKPIRAFPILNNGSLFTICKACIHHMENEDDDSSGGGKTRRKVINLEDKQIAALTLAEQKQQNYQGQLIDRKTRAAAIQALKKLPHRKQAKLPRHHSPNNLISPPHKPTHSQLNFLQRIIRTRKVIRNNC